MTRRETAGLTATALIGFAANSLLCRLALKTGSVDPASFTAVRLASGALVLALLARGGGPARPHGGGWGSATALFVYAMGFSYAYVSVSAGVGALLLFGAVQLTMIGWGVVSGERPRALQWVGIVIAAAGLVALSLPTLSASSPLGMGLMALAGAAWGVYSLRGRGASKPLQTTAANFLRTVPMVAGALALSHAFAPAHLTTRGLLLAVASGAVASGLGYAVWYRALPGLTAVQAASLQLVVPVLAATAAVPLLDERLTPGHLAAAALILGGLGLSIAARHSSRGEGLPLRRRGA